MSVSATPQYLYRTSRRWCRVLPTRTLQQKHTANLQLYTQLYKLAVKTPNNQHIAMLDTLPYSACIDTLHGITAQSTSVINQLLRRSDAIEHTYRSDNTIQTNTHNLTTFMDRNTVISKQLSEMKSQRKQRQEHIKQHHLQLPSPYG